MLNNIFSVLRNRAKAVVSSIVISVVLCGCGAVMTFYLAPTQALKAYRISQMPLMDAQSVADAGVGSNVIVTGSLTGDPTREQPEFIAYTKHEWDVTVTEDDEGNEGTPSGSWSLIQTVIPVLMLEMNGSPVQILANEGAALSGALREKIIDGEGSLQASYENQTLRDGAIRYSGFADGDLATVYGVTASVGGIFPEDIFAGDRVAFEKYQKNLASGYLMVGIAFMLCSPLVLVGGVFSSVFGRRK